MPAWSGNPPMVALLRKVQLLTLRMARLAALEQAKRAQVLVQATANPEKTR